MPISLNASLQNPLGIVDATWKPFEPKENLLCCRRTIDTMDDVVSTIQIPGAQISKTHHTTVIADSLALLGGRCGYD